MHPVRLCISATKPVELLRGSVKCGSAPAEVSLRLPHTPALALLSR